MNYLALMDRGASEHDGESASAPSPGKVSLTQRMSARTTPPVAVDGAVVQARAAPGAPPIDDPFAVHLGSSTAGSSGLPSATAAQLGAAFGIDLGGVRVRTDSDEATALGAQAFARGDELHFAPGRYDGGGASHLVAHEVAHLVQQAEGRVAPTVQAKGGALNDAPELEAEADRMADAALAGQTVRTGPLLQPRATPVAQGFLTHYGKRVDHDHDAVVAARAKAKKAGATLFELSLFDDALTSDQRKGTLASFRDNLLEGISRRLATEARRAPVNPRHAEDDEPRDKRKAPEATHDAKRRRPTIEPDSSSSEEDEPDTSASSSEEEPDGKGNGSDEGEGEGEVEGEEGPDLLDYYAASQVERSSSEASDSEDEPVAKQPAKKTPEVLAPRARGGALPNVGPFATKQMKSQIGKQSRTVDKADELQALSRLAHLIESVSSGTTCGAVVLHGSTLVITANTTGKAMAINAMSLLAALTTKDFDTALDQLELPKDLTSQFGATDVTDEELPTTSKVRGKSALTMATDFRTNELGFTSAKKKAEVAPQAKVDAQRRLDSTAAWLQENPIDRIIVHDGAKNEKHAEMRMLDAVHRFLAAGGELDAPLSLGISKLCCGMCILGVQLFRALHPGVTIEIQGTHTNTYGKWPIPDFVLQHLDRFADLAKAVGKSELKAHVQGNAIQEPLRSKLIEALRSVDVGGPQGKNPERPAFKHHTDTEYWSDGKSSSESEGEDDSSRSSKGEDGSDSES